MSSHVARSLAFLSALGFVVSICSYIYSLLGVMVDKVFWLLALAPLWIALFLPMYILEYPESRKVSFGFTGFARGMPRWVAPCSWLFQLAFVAHFVRFSVQSGFGVPEIVDGQYVLANRGRVLRLLTDEEYRALLGAELRLLATTLMFLYFVTTAYWWLRPTSTHSDSSGIVSTSAG
jgi:hypothetical protein